MIPYRLIARKRDGLELAADEVKAFFRGFADGDVPDYQMAAMLMAVYFRGLSDLELAALVDVMVHSGRVVDLSSVPGRKVDKHSTGGVGDKVSLVLAPLVASLGVPVPMISGRGLAHSGGTLDKLEAIPGFRTDLDLEAYGRQVADLGCALVGQTDDLAPLDRRLYALRDVTGTVEAIPLIASSIMSKKLAAGPDALVLDVKRGEGAFVPELDRALVLAKTMIGIGRSHGREVTALVTAMDRPLGIAVGNALETEEAIETLRGGGPADLVELTIALAGEMLRLGDAAPDAAAGRRQATAALADGRAFERMARIVEAQGGDPRVMDEPERLPRAPVRRVVETRRGGFVTRVRARAIGEAAVALGAGRTTLGATIDPAAGLHVLARPGAEVRAGEPIATVFARSEEDAVQGAAAVLAAIEIEEEPGPQPLPLISHRVAADGVVEEWKAAGVGNGVPAR